MPELPDDSLVYLMGSRYCETDKLSQFAWDIFGTVAPGWGRVQAICDFVHGHIEAENRVDEDKAGDKGEVSELDPGKSGTLTVELKAGKYLLICNVPGHYGGMTLASVWPS